MQVISDLYRLLINCIAFFCRREPTIFLSTLLTGFFLAFLCWFFCSRYARMWNLRYHITLTHHILCGIAAVLTLLFTITFASLKYTRTVAESLIAVWQAQILSDSAWEQKTFRKAYDTIKGLGLEDFSKVPDPDHGGNQFPITNTVSRQKVANIYSTEAVSNFNKTHPYLSKILSVDSGITLKIITDDISAFFTNNPHELSYNATNAVKLAANAIQQMLSLQTPRIVPLSRTIIVLLFIIVQAIPFGLVGMAAYQDLKVVT